MSTDFARVGDADIFNAITSFVLQLRRVEKYRHSILFIHAEANDWTKSNRYCEELLMPDYGPGLREANSVDASGAGRYGIYTDDEEKIHWADALTHDFMSGSVCYASEFVSQDGDTFKHMFEEEVRYFRDEKKAVTDEIFQKVQHKYTGKGPGGKKDDRVSAYCLASWQMKRLRQTAKGRAFALKHGVIM